MADNLGFSRFFSVDEALIPERPDDEADPTLTITRIIRSSRSKAIRSAVLPAHGASVAVGPLYEAKIIEFGENVWKLQRAAGRSDSLKRARKAIRAMASRWSRYTQGIR